MKASGLVAAGGLAVALALLIGFGLPLMSGPAPLVETAEAQTPKSEPPTSSAPAAPEPSQQPPSGSLAPLIQKLRPTVVGVTSERRAAPGGGPADMNEFWRRFFGGGGEGGPSPFDEGPEGQMGLGSGVIIDAKGIVLTNNHVVEGADTVLVRTADEKEYRAEVRGADPATDIAVLQLKDVREPLTAAPLGSSQALRVGDPVLAIGSPFGLELTVTSGIVSAKERVIGAGPYDDFLQTDAAINPGNSGGPLFDIQGRVVGINTAIVASGQGIGFAVPIDLVKSLLPQLLEKGRVVRGYLGMQVQDLTPELAEAMGVSQKQGALVSSVEPKAPAAKAGFKTGDIIVSLDGDPVKSAGELTRKVAMLPPGRQVTVQYLRDGRARTERVALGERPARRGEQQRQPSREEEGQSALGLSLQPVPPEMARALDVEAGALVSDVEPGSRASRAGIAPGDVIVEANRKPVREPKDLVAAVRESAGKSLVLRVVDSRGARFVAVPGEK